MSREALRPEVLFAEVVHQPDGRVGNILARPVLRKFEIPYLGVSGAPQEQQLPPQDLTVGLEGDRLVLRSLRMDCEVVPRLTSAHNYTQGLPVYRFLAQLQDQDGGQGGWSWGNLAQLPFLPRVARGRHVLAKARWRVEAEDLAPVLKAQGPSALAAFEAMRQALRLPRWVVLEDGDNTLWVDLDHPERVEMLLQLVSTWASFTLVEAFPGPGELVAEGPEGRFCHELVVPFQRHHSRVRTEPAAQVAAAGAGPRTFLPGSEWLTLKIYTGEATADRILLDTLGPLLAATRGLWDQWFFLRYADPAPHLRVRFHGVPGVLTGSLLPRIHQALEPLVQAGVCWKVVLDTYEREWERYGGEVGMPLAESWFEVDSQRALELLGACRGDEGSDQRWRWALQGMDAVLNGLGFDLPAKLEIVTRIRTSLGLEFQAQGGLEHHLGDRFRSLRRGLEGLLADPGAGAGAGGLGAEDREQRLRLARLEWAAELGQLSTSLEHLAASLIHMRVNRLVRSSPRAHEFVFADFLARIYRSRLARRAAPATLGRTESPGWVA